MSINLPAKFVTKTILAAALLFLSIGSTVISGCNVNNSDSSTGTLEMFLTDAPATYEAVYIDIQEVQLNTGSEQQEEWITLNSQPLRVDLLKLDNGAETLLGTAQLETGTYSQIRLILGPNNEVIDEGSSNQLTVPSGAESGYKVNLNATIVEDSTLTKIVDFDVARSIAVTGNGEYILNPVLKVFDPEETGSVSGQIVPQGVPALVSAQIGNEILATTYVEDDGTFMLRGLEENVYKILIQPDSQAHADTTLFEKEVFAGTDTDLGILQLPEN